MAFPEGPVRRRAGIVCIQCHARKVKCDLQHKQDGQCSNCTKANQQCQRRQGCRRRSERPTTAWSPGSSPSVSNADENIPSTARQAPPLGFLGEESFLSSTYVPESNTSQLKETAVLSERVAELTHVALLPPPPLMNALIDVYFLHLFPFIPVVDRHDLLIQPRSILLWQCLSMVGSHFRRLPASTPTSDHYYFKVKMLIAINHEEDNLTVLKSICLIASRSQESPTKVSLNSPWHWIGVGIRYALNMGLHREATYSGLSAPGVSRRIWWNLLNQDKLQSLCYGRPPIVRAYEVETRLPTLDDFAVSHADNEIFIQRTRLCMILGKVSDAQHGRQRESILEEVTNIGEYLRDWIHNLPESLHLYNESLERNPYRRLVCELHIMYFTGVILFYRLVEKPNLCLTSLKASVAAASAIAALFEEIYFRGEVISMLPINNWYCMVASVPLIHAIARLSNTKPLHREDLAKIRLFLQEMTANTPSTNLILANIDRVQQATIGATSDAAQAHRTGENGNQESREDYPCAARCHRIDPLVLLPFPSTLCSSMNLLPLGGGDVGDISSLPILQLLEADSSIAFNFDLDDVQLDQFTTVFEGSNGTFNSIL